MKRCCDLNTIKYFLFLFFVFCKKKSSKGFLIKYYHVSKLKS